MTRFNYVYTIILLIIPCFLIAQDLPLTRQQWSEDINFLITSIEREHPNPYWRISKNEFQKSTDQLIADLPDLSAAEIQVRMIQLVASLEDGHTDLAPYGRIGFKAMFPIRLYEFTDGFFITAISKVYAEIVGAEVVKIGKYNVQEAIEGISSLWNNENEYRKREGGIFYLTSPDALKALGIIDQLEILPLTVRLKSGEIREINISSIQEDFDLSFIYWGEMWGPGSVDYVTGIDQLSPGEYYDQKNEALPLHLRYRSMFWFTYLESDKVLYLQLNGLGDSNKENFSSFLGRLWSVVDDKEIDKFIMDIRYNVGGDGSRVNEIVHGFIKRDHINTPKKLFTILGRSTFSAGINLAAAMKDHTKTNFAGAPAGAYFNHNGDATIFTLPNSQMELSVSTVWHQPVSSRDKSQLICIDIPIEFSSDDYFNRKDPVVDFIILNDYIPPKELIFTNGAKEGILAYENLSEKYGHISWWCALEEKDWNEIGYTLSEEGKKQDALIVFQYNTQLYPNSWKACDSLAELFAEIGNKKESVFWYQKALAINPVNFNAEFQKEMIEKQSN